MYLPVVLHSLCVIQILMISNARSDLGAQKGLICGHLHNQEAWLCISHIPESQSISLLCYLVLCQKKQLLQVKESMEKISSQQSIEGVWVSGTLESE